MKKIQFIFTALFFISCLTGCKTTLPVPDVFETPDYTEEDVVAQEIIRIQSMMDNNSVKALWRAVILDQSVSGTPDVENTLAACIDSVVNEYHLCLNQENYMEALRLHMALENVPGVNSNVFEYSRQDLRNLCQKGIQALDSVDASQDSSVKVASMISGTVTVYVDKGIKIEKGVGYADGVLGSGFFISSDGYIITNHHVISDCVDPKYEGYSRLYIKLAGDSDTRIPARVVGYDSVIDLALIKAEVDAPYVFTLGSSNDLDVGDRVYAIGSPLGLERTLTSGIISAKDRQLFTMGKVFQLDAAINSGNSGGPMVDEKGRVQAIVFAGVQNYQGLNFAIPVEYLRQELMFLYAGGKRIHSWTGAYGKTKKLPVYGAEGQGVEVFYSMPGSSSYRTGITEGSVIVAVDGIDVKTLDDLQNILIAIPSETIIKITTMDQDEKLKDHIVYLDKRPENPGYEVYTHDTIYNSFLPLIGIKMVNSSGSKRNICTVVSVLKGSAGEEYGFSQGDPVTVMGVDADIENSTMHIQLNAKKKQGGFLEVNLGFTVSMDSPYYF